MFDGEVYADFVVLWLLCHQSRVEGERSELYWLEKWTQLAEKRGTRVLEESGVSDLLNRLMGTARHLLSFLLKRPILRGLLNQARQRRSSQRHIHAYLKQFEQPLRERQDKGTHWWELRSCDYYGDFERPKVIVQCIAYYSQFAFDE